MFSVLLESRAVRPRRLNSTMLSTTVHCALIAGLVALSLPGRRVVRPNPPIYVDTLRFVRPTLPAPATSSNAPHSAPTAGQLSLPQLPTIDVPVTTPSQIPPIDLSVPATGTDAVLNGHGAAGGLTEGLPGLGSEAGAGGVSDVRAVDRAPAVVGRPIEPRYPPTLRSAGIEGRVLAEFVVDTLGRAELASLRFPELANPLFGDAVRDALARYRFTPGEVAGRKVRTRVAMPFEFRLTK